tara:strand:- start:1459 stop:2064 length:606 start_codon:yes stop_codon:yes gene_type:complete
MPISVLSGNATQAGSAFAASATPVDLYKFTQDFGLSYRVVNYKTIPTTWPPSDTCTTASALEVTWGSAYTLVEKIHDMQLSGNVGTYTQQNYSFSSVGSTSGIGTAGTIYSNAPASHTRIWNTTADANVQLGYTRENYYMPGGNIVVVPFGDHYIIDGLDGGSLAAQFMTSIIDSIQSGGLQNNLSNWTRGIHNWRTDLVD